MVWGTVISAAGVVVALVTFGVQLHRLAADARQRDADRRRERALELYRDLVVEGDTTKAFECVSVMLRKEGARRFQMTTWYVMDDKDFEPGGLLDPAVDSNAELVYQNFYRVLWYFERVESALFFQLIDSEVLFRSIGFHCWWWGSLLKDIRAPKAVEALHKLAPLAADWARESGEYGRWRDRCATDFDGGPPAPNL
jgi:hypothetical protein